MIVTILYRIKCFTEIVKLFIKDYCLLPLVVWNLKKLDSAPEPFAQMVYAATVLVKSKDTTSRFPGRQSVRFFRFPKDAQMRKKWSGRLGRDAKFFTPTDESQ